MVSRLAILVLLAGAAWAQPRRIVSMAPSITEMLYAMDLGARVVGAGLDVDLVKDFIAARFSGAERHRRRLAKVSAFEESFGK